MMEFMDLLFREYADPFSLLDQVIRCGRLIEFLQTFYKKHDEKLRWEFYINKLSPLDERSWDEFNHDLDFGTTIEQQERPSDEEIAETVKHSYGMMKNFKPEGD